MFKDIINGITAYGRALSLTAKLGLWGYFFVPALISLFLAGVIGYSAYSLADHFGAILINWYPFEWGAGVIEKIASVASGLALGATGILLYKNLVIVLAGPFMSPLSEKVENYLTGSTHNTQFKAAKMIRDIIRGLRIALRLVVRELFYTLVLILLGLIPIFAPFTAIAIFLVQSFYGGAGNMDYALERHFDVRGSIRFVQDNRGVALGNGIVFIGLLLTGVGFLVAPPLAAIAATIESVKKLDGPVVEAPKDYV